jgi:DNA-binding MarR family transcriptional regulator
MTELNAENRASLSRRADEVMRHDLESLFVEVNALAIRLRQHGTPADQGNLLAGSRSILQVLEQHGPQTVPQIARIRSTSRQNIQTLVNRLKLEGCIEIAGNPAHKRSVLVSITESGRALLASSMEHEVRFMQDLLAQVSKNEVTAATTLLCRLRQLLSRTGSPPEVIAGGASGRGAGLASRRKSPPRLAEPEELEPEQSELPVNLL